MEMKRRLGPVQKFVGRWSRSWARVSTGPQTLEGKARPAKWAMPSRNERRRKNEKKTLPATLRKFDLEEILKDLEPVK